MVVQLENDLCCISSVRVDDRTAEWAIIASIYICIYKLYIEKNLQVYILSTYEHMMYLPSMFLMNRSPTFQPGL